MIDIQKKGWFKIGNQEGASYPIQVYIDIFERMYNFTVKDKTVMSLQDVYAVEFKMPKATFFLTCNRIEECMNYKEGMMDVIAARVNKLALKGEAPPSPAIWRMKQCGEIDSSTVNQNHSGIPISEHRIIFENYKKDEEDL